jgi:hypothetical protein
MAGIFISLTSEDGPLADTLRDALKALLGVLRPERAQTKQGYVVDTTVS